MRTALPRRTGFTLVETMVVLAIFALLTASGFQFANNMNAREDFNTTVNEIITSLRTARNLAITQQRPEGTTRSSNGVYADFAGTGTDKTVELRAVYGTNPLVSYGPKKYYDPNGTVNVNISGVLIFTTLEGKLSDSYDGTPVGVGVSIGVSSVAVGVTKVIYISPSGAISD